MQTTRHSRLDKGEVALSSGNRTFRLAALAMTVVGSGLSLDAAGQAAGDYIESTQCSAYSSIASAPGAVMLATISACDDCTELVNLPFTFNWYGDTPVTAVQVSSNGQVNINSGDTNSNCCSADPVEIGGNTQPRIAFAQEDIGPDDYGDVYALNTGSSYIIDFAGTAFFPSTGVLNAQVELFPNGDVEVRWGTITSSGNALAVGVEDDSRPSATPATGAGFTGAPGVAPDGSALSGQCRRLTAQAQPVVSTVAVPTLSGWASAALFVLLGALGIGRLRRRQA